MTALFHIARTGAGWLSFEREFPDDVRAAYQALPAGSDYIGWLRTALRDERFEGHAMVWSGV